jgi:hypothetical protein
LQILKIRFTVIFKLLSDDRVTEYFRKVSPAEAELCGPRGVEISKAGLVVVADTTNHCVSTPTIA